MEKQIIKIRIENFSDRTTFVIQRSDPISKFIIEDLMNLTCEKMIIAETKDKCSYNIENENRMIA